MPKQNIVKLTKCRGKFVHSMGYTMLPSNISELTTSDDATDRFEYFYPEEALYLLENVNKTSHMLFFLILRTLKVHLLF